MVFLQKQTLFHQFIICKQHSLGGYTHEFKRVIFVRWGSYGVYGSHCYVFDWTRQMSTFTTDDRIAVENFDTKEKCYLLAVKVVNRNLIPWPENADSKLWNDRVNSLLSSLCLEFGFDGESE